MTESTGRGAGPYSPSPVHHPPPGCDCPICEAPELYTPAQLRHLAYHDRYRERPEVWGPTLYRMAGRPVPEGKAWPGPRPPIPRPEPPPPRRHARTPPGPIHGFYHLATMGDYRRVLAAQLAALEASGLAGATARLHVRVSGDGPIPPLPAYAEASRNDAPLGQGEVPTLGALKAFCRENPRALVYYLHAKGVSYGEGDPRRANVELWREYLEHFVVGRWREAVGALADHDLHGPEWVEPGPEYTRGWGGGRHECPGRGHFAGNFWWARADYVASLPDRPLASRMDAEWHFLAEVAPGAPPPRVSCPHRAGIDLYEHPYPRSRYAGDGRRVEPGTIVSAARLAADALALASRLPADVDAVCAIARSGLVPGSLIAAARHLPLYTVSRQAGVLMPGHGIRMEDAGRPGGPPSHVALVDDTVGNGVEMGPCERLVREAFPGARLTRAAVYAAPRGVARVDLYHAVYEGAHFLEWNWPNSHGVHAAFDFDGILCEDCPAADDDDGPRYAVFLDAARPLYLPRRAPIKLIVTARHEKYRGATEAWLSRHGVRVDRLVMRDWDFAPARDPAEQAADWKARHYRDSGLPLFIESDPWQARLIRDLSGLPVLCPSLGRVLPAPSPSAAARPPRVEFDPGPARAVLSCPDRRREGCGCHGHAVCLRDGRRVALADCLSCVAPPRP